MVVKGGDVTGFKHPTGYTIPKIIFQTLKRFLGTLEH